MNSAVLATPEGLRVSLQLLFCAAAGSGLYGQSSQLCSRWRLRVNVPLDGTPHQHRTQDAGMWGKLQTSF